MSYLDANVAYARFQKERQPGDDPGDDEDRYEHMPFLGTRAIRDRRLMGCLGHVEKTNDRDYEVEERYGCGFLRSKGLLPIND